MTEMIERLAKVIGPMQDVCSPGDIAKEVLLAMREPTPEMEAAWFGGDGWVVDRDDPLNHYLRDKSRGRLAGFWQLMISACLGSEKAEPAMPPEGGC